MEYNHTNESINIEMPGKEYALQHTKRGYRCISWSPHYIMTNWVKKKENAIIDGDKAIKNFYDEMAKAGEQLDKEWMNE